MIHKCTDGHYKFPTLVGVHRVEEVKGIGVLHIQKGNLSRVKIRKTEKR